MSNFWDNFGDYFFGTLFVLVPILLMFGCAGMLVNQ